jgi:hypothetical protein
MFSNLSKGSVLYGLDTRGNVKLFTASVERVGVPMPKYMQNTFGQLPETVVDIVATVNGERKEFKQVPSNNAIADFGPDAFVLADNKDSLVNYVNAKLQESRNIVNSVDRHKALISQYEEVLSSISPHSSNDNAVRELREQVGSLQSQLAEALALLKEKTSKKE